MNMVFVLKALGDETRLRILNLLRQETLCVCDIEEILQINQSNASRHLLKLKGADIIVGEKKAQWVYYSLNNILVREWDFLRELIFSDLGKNIQFEKDSQRLQRYKDKGGGCENPVKLADE